MVEKPLNLFAIPSEIQKFIDDAGGVEIYLQQMVASTSLDEATLQAHEETYRWVFGDKYNDALQKEEKIAIVERTIFVAQGLCEALAQVPLYDQNGRVTDEYVATLKQALYNLAPILTEWKYTRTLDHNGIPVERQSASHMANVFTHLLTMLEYADPVVGVMNARRAKDKHPPIDLNAYKVFALLHDLGRWITQESEVHERLEQFMFRILNVPQDFLDFEFEASPRFRSSDPADRDVTSIPDIKLATVISDINSKFASESKQDELRAVDQESVQRMVIDRALHYYIVPKRPDKPKEELEIEAKSKPINDLESWIRGQFELAAEESASVVDESLVNRVCNEFTFLGQLTAYFEEICKGQGTSFTHIRAEVNTRVKEKMDNGTFYPVAGHEKLLQPNVDLVFEPIDQYGRTAAVAILSAYKGMMS